MARTIRALLIACVCMLFVATSVATECDLVLSAGEVECIGGARVRPGDTLQCVVTGDAAQAFIMSVLVKHHTGNTVCGLAGL